MAADFFRDLATRILKTRYFQNADLLAEEIAAWARGDGPVTLDRPLVLDQSSPAPPLQFLMKPLDPAGETFPPPFTINVKGGDVGDVPSFPGGTTVFDGGLSDTWNAAPIDFKLPDDPWASPERDDINDRPGRPTTDPVVVGGSGGGAAFYGVVVSGSGTTYSVEYTKADGSTEVDDFTMPTLDASVTLDPGTPATVFVADGANRFLVPVWV